MLLVSTAKQKHHQPPLPLMGEMNRGHAYNGYLALHAPPEVMCTSHSSCMCGLSLPLVKCTSRNMAHPISTCKPDGACEALKPFYTWPLFSFLIDGSWKVAVLSICAGKQGTQNIPFHFRQKQPETQARSFPNLRSHLF